MRRVNWLVVTATFSIIVILAALAIVAYIWPLFIQIIIVGLLCLALLVVVDYIFAPPRIE